ncbi:hypothetical protein C8R44DRAFT_640076 [Mycena epipterygia]|nr:hypothetical protein C8R44DRAFT_640076 [Mycena epipterygia]
MPAPSGDENAAAQCPDDTAPWFRHAFQEVAREDLGVAYSEVLRAFIEMERQKGFVKGTGKLVSSQERPAQVSEWVRDGRGRTKAMLAVTNVAAFEKTWWGWWLGMQPEWRECGTGGRPETPQKYGKGWGGMLGGQNGVLSVVASLYWWGYAEKMGATGSTQGGWEAAVKDVVWVLTGMAAGA